MKNYSLAVLATWAVISAVVMSLPAGAQTGAAPDASSAASSEANQALKNTPKATAPWGDNWQGPLSLENERPFQAIFLRLPAQNPDVLSRGRSRLGLQVDVANDLLIPKTGANGARVTEDFETQRLKVSWSKGFGRGLEGGIGSNLTARNGGFLDSTVELVHKLFNTEGISKSARIGRENIPQGRSILAFIDASGKGINEGNAFGLGDTTVWLKKQISRKRTLSTSASVALKLPTGKEGAILGSGSFDAGISFDARYRLARRFALFGNIGGAKYGNSDIPGAANNGFWGAVGYEWKVGHRDSVIGQINYQNRGVTTDNEFADRRPVIASLGYKKKLNDKHAYWLAIGENGDYRNYKWPALFNIGPDVTLSFGYEFRR